MSIMESFKAAFEDEYSRSRRILSENTVSDFMHSDLSGQRYKQFKETFLARDEKSLCHIADSDVKANFFKRLLPLLKASAKETSVEKSLRKAELIVAAQQIAEQTIQVESEFAGRGDAYADGHLIDAAQKMMFGIAERYPEAASGYAAKLVAQKIYLSWKKNEPQRWMSVLDQILEQNPNASQHGDVALAIAKNAASYIVSIPGHRDDYEGVWIDGSDDTTYDNRVNALAIPELVAITHPEKAEEALAVVEVFARDRNSSVLRRVLQTTVSVLDASQNLGENPDMVEKALGMVNAVEQAGVMTRKDIATARRDIYRQVDEKCPDLKIMTCNFVVHDNKSRMTKSGAPTL